MAGDDTDLSGYSPVMVDEAPPSSDRRRAPRRVACFPSYVDRGADARVTALIADLSEGGALLLLRKPDWAVGDELRLELYVTIDAQTPRVATGKTLRIEPLPDERISLWTHQVAVEFHDAIVLTPEELEALEKREAPYHKHA